MELLGGEFCQSCGMAMSLDTHGTETDGTKSAEFCANCYTDGRFTSPEITREGMVETARALMKAQGLPEAVITHRIFGIPNLARWREN